MGWITTVLWLRRNWWMLFAILGGPLLAISTLLLVRWLRFGEPRQLPPDAAT
jgi:hypothetical protein